MKAEQREQTPTVGAHGEASMDAITEFLTAGKALGESGDGQLAGLPADVQAFVGKALRAASEIALKCVHNSGGHLGRDGATTIARAFGQAYGNHTDAPEYLPRTPEAAASFMPAGWVIASIMQGYREGHGEGHAEGIQWMKDANARRRQAQSRDASGLQMAAQAVLDRWDSPSWKWSKEGHTADLMHALRRELADPAGAAGDTSDAQASMAGQQAQSARYSVERHGSGWAIYMGRDVNHHGLNLGQLSECDEGIAQLVERGLNHQANANTTPTATEAVVQGLGLDRDAGIKVWHRHCDSFAHALGTAPSSRVVDAMLAFAAQVVGGHGWISMAVGKPSYSEDERVLVVTPNDDWAGAQFHHIKVADFYPEGEDLSDAQQIAAAASHWMYEPWPRDGREVARGVPRTPEGEPLGEHLARLARKHDLSGDFRAAIKQAVELLSMDGAPASGTAAAGLAGARASKVCGNCGECVPGCGGLFSSDGSACLFHGLQGSVAPEAPEEGDWLSTAVGKLADAVSTAVTATVKAHAASSGVDDKEAAAHGKLAETLQWFDRHVRDVLSGVDQVEHPAPAGAAFLSSGAAQGGGDVAVPAPLDDAALIPCPWCKTASLISLSSEIDGSHIGYVHCAGCGACGPESLPRLNAEDARADARAAWQGA